MFGMTLLSPLAYAQVDWLQFGFLPDKTGNNTLETKITLGDVGGLQPLFTTPLSHNPDGAPVLLTGVTTPSGVRDLIFVFAEQGYTTAFDANTGAQVWTADFSTGAPVSGGPPYPDFASIQTSNTSPAIDPNRLYVYTFGMDGNVHKLNVGDGSEVTGGGWPERIMNDDGKARGAFTIATAANGHTYLYGNADNTEGNMTTIDLGTGAQHVFNTSNAQDPDTHSPSGGYGAATPWSRGPAYNAALDRVFFTTGTYANFVPGHDWVESLLGMAPDGSTNIVAGGGYPVDSYTPTAWQTYINDDADLGSANIIQLPTGLSGKYPHLAVMGSKDTTIRIFNLANLSGKGAPGNTGGELQQIPGPNGGLIRSQGTTWTDPATGIVWVFVPGNNGICGLQVAIDGSGNPTLVTKWTLNNGWTTSAIVANGVLFAAVGGGEHTDTTATHSLQAINPTTGAVVWSGAIGQFHWASPIVVNGIVYMTDGNSGGFGTGTDGNLHAWHLSGGGGGSFTLAPSSGSLSVTQGGSATDTIDVTDLAGFAGSVTLSASGLPSGVTAAFGTNPTTGSSALTLTASGSATAGTSTIAIKGVSGSLTASAAIALTVAKSVCGAANPIVPYVALNGVWNPTPESAVTVAAGAKVSLGPWPTSGGAWSWTGPNNFTSAAREIDNIALSAGANAYTATYTVGGCSYTQAFVVTVNSANPIVPYIALNGVWNPTTESAVTVAAGTQVSLGPWPTSGGAWSWTGPNGFTSKSREIDNIALPSTTDVYTATYTIDGTAYTQAFTVTVSGGSGTLIANGTYIVASVESGLAIDDPGSSATDGEDMQLYTVNDGTNQQWKINNVSANVITLTNVSSGQLLDVAGASKAAQALVVQEPADGATHQEWNVVSVGSGIFELTNVNSGLALDVVGGGTTNKTAIDQYAYGGATWQQWKFIAP
jgi:hypothetical protein